MKKLADLVLYCRYVLVGYEYVVCVHNMQGKFLVRVLTSPGYCKI